MKCKYCVHFQKGAVRRRGEGAQKVISRQCSVVQHNVQAEDISCDEIKLAKYFWCHKSGYWLDFKLCFHRKRKKYPGCIRCSQHRIEIRSLRALHWRQQNEVEDEPFTRTKQPNPFKRNK